MIRGKEWSGKAVCFGFRLASSPILHGKNRTINLPYSVFVLEKRIAA